MSGDPTRRRLTALERVQRAAGRVAQIGELLAVAWMPGRLSAASRGHRLAALRLIEEAQQDSDVGTQLSRIELAGLHALQANVCRTLAEERGDVP